MQRSERELLLAYLADQRNHVLTILEGLDEASLQRPMLPTGWSCLGMLRHLAIDVERFWFRCVLAGQPEAIASLETMSNAWIVPPETSAADVLALYRREIALANAALAHVSLEATPVWWPVGLFGDWTVQNARQVLLHVMTETATHAGHADIVRETIDGKTWLILTG